MSLPQRGTDIPARAAGPISPALRAPASDAARPAGIPPKQHNYEDAVRLAMAAVRRQSAEQLEWLGARPEGRGRWSVQALDEMLTVDLAAGTVAASSSGPVSVWWKMLALHYLGVAGRPAELPPSLIFADLPGGRVYAPVYQARVIQRLCRTAGRDRATLLAAARAIGGQEAGDFPARDLTADFRMFPRVSLRLVWHAGDDEFSPSATILLPANIEAFFCIEDITVLSESLVGRLSGKR